MGDQLGGSQGHGFVESRCRERSADEAVHFDGGVRLEGRGLTSPSGLARQPRQTERVDSNPFPLGFFDRSDGSGDAVFYSWPRLVKHLDDHAIAAVGALYDELGISGDVLDLMSSWVSHFNTPPARLTALGMNSEELDANPSARVTVVHDLNAEPRLPFPDESFDDAVCCVSVDYLTRPIEVFRDVARVLRPGGSFVCTFSNRCFPTKAIRGWLYADDEQRCEIVEKYFRLAGRWDEPHSQRRTPVSHFGDPLLAVWARRAGRALTDEPGALTEIDADR
jgi:SAM-dependent methyltransferase